MLHMLKQEIDLPQIVGKDAAENEHTYQSETPGNENISTKHSEGKLTMESSTKSSYDVEELAKISESHSVDNSETKCDGKLMAEKEIGIKEATEVKLQKSETASNYVFIILNLLFYIFQHNKLVLFRGGGEEENLQGF